MRSLSRSLAARTSSAWSPFRSTAFTVLWLATVDPIVQGANPDVVIVLGRHEDHFEEGSKAVNMLTRALGCVLFSAQTQSPAVTTSIGG
jgi:hypothetical protein